MNAAEIIDYTIRRTYCEPAEEDRERVVAGILATLDAIRELPAEITDSSASAERDFAVRWYNRIDALKREVAG